MTKVTSVSKMNPVKPQTLARQAEISRVCRSISHVSIEQEIAELPEFLKALGTANAEHVLDKIPDDLKFT